MKGKKLILSLSIMFTFLFCIVLGVTIFTMTNVNNPKPQRPTEAAHLEGSGTSQDPYLIYTVTGYRQFYLSNTANYNKVYAKLMGDLIITGSTNMPLWQVNESKWWNGDCFPGGLEFDGNYKEIRCSADISLDNSQCTAIGPVPRLDGPSVIKNLKTRGSITIEGKSSYSTHVGGLIGFASGTNADGFRYPNITIENCYVATDIKSNSSSTTSLAGFIGYACDSSGNFSSGQISVSNSIFCGSISGSCTYSGKITTKPSGTYKISISQDNSYVTGSIPNQTADQEPGVGFSSAYEKGSGFVKGDWKTTYASCNYRANPNLSWVQKRNGMGKSPYSVSYKVITTRGKQLASGENGYLIGVTKDTDWIYSDGYIKLYNFKVLDRSIDISSYIKDYIFVEATSTYSYQNKTIEIVITFDPPKINIYFNLAANTNAYYSVSGATFAKITSYYPQTVTNSDKIKITYINYGKTKAYSVLEFSFTNYDGEAVIIKYEISDNAYFISKFEYKIKDTPTWVAASNVLTEISIGNIREFRVATELKSYNVEVK